MIEKLRHLLPYFRPYRARMTGGVLSILASAVIGLATPLLVGGAVDSFREDPTARTLYLYAGLIVLVAAVRGVFTYLQRMILVTVSRDVEFDLRNEYFAHLETLPVRFYQEHATGDLMARATNDLQAVRMLCGPAIMYSGNTLFAGLGSLYFMFRIHPGLSLLALAPMPLLAFATKVFGERIHHLFDRVQEEFSTLSARVQENLAGLRVVRAYARETREEERFRRTNDEYVDRNRRLILWSSAFHPLLQLLVGLGFVAVLFYGGRLVVDGGITIGEFVTFNFFLVKLIWPMIAIGWVINLVQRGAASLGRIRQILTTEPTIRDEPPLVELPAVRGRIEARDLTFRYDPAGSAALDQVSFEAPAGSTVAIVGRTGAGKSTLLSLIPRLLDPPPGSIRLDGEELRSVPLEQLRRAIAMVPQETFLFSVTIRENIVLGRPGASEAEIREAAELAGLGSDLEGFPKGLDTLVGERGITLSGGQKQRVALARALSRRPEILLLDDCLSAVDAHTEEEILQNLRRVFPGRTVFLVSHRISAVRDADQILVLDAGRIAERGRHDELLALGGIYADLAERQRLEEELAVL